MSDGIYGLEQCKKWSLDKLKQKHQRLSAELSTVEDELMTVERATKERYGIILND